MKDPSSRMSFFEGDSITRLLQGMAVGVVGTLAVGFGVGGWNLGDTVMQKVAIADRDATIAALAPICADRFGQAASADSALASSYRAVNAWDRSTYLMKDGWVTFAGGSDPNYEVASECATLVTAEFKLK